MVKGHAPQHHTRERFATVLNTCPLPKVLAVIGKFLEDRFRLEQKIGEGGMATVWRATDVVSGREFAIKLLKSATTDPAVRERFLREAETQARLKSPHVARIFYFGRDMKHGLFIVMELIHGDDLTWLLPHGRLPLALSMEIIDQTLAGLDHAHSQGVIHRDLKPANLKLTVENGALCVKLLDFGFVRLTHTDRTLTADGMVGGTLTYISPEELELKELDHRLDLYSLAAVWFELHAGRPPFVAKTPQLTAVKHLTELPPRISDFVETPEEVVDLLAWMLEKDREHRPDSAANIREYIAAIRNKYGIRPPQLHHRGPSTDPITAWQLIKK